MKRLAAALTLAIMFAAVPAASANAAVPTPQAVIDKYGEAIATTSNGQYVVNNNGTYIIVDANGNYTANYNAASPNSGTVVKNVTNPVTTTVENPSTTPAAPAESTVENPVVPAERTSPKTGEFPVSAALSLTAVVSAAGVALCWKKEND